MTKHKVYPFKGAYLSARQIARLIGMKQRTLYQRLANGMSIEEAISTPIRHHGETNPNGPKPKLYEFRGKWMTVAEIARATGYSLTKIYKRRSGTRIFDDHEIEVMDRDPHPRARLYTYRGQTDSIAGWARSRGIKEATVYSRLKAGWPIERAIRVKPLKLKDTITYKGKTLTIDAWAKQSKIGISAQALKYRILAGWPVHDALTKPTKRTNFYSHDGKSLTIDSWAALTGISAEVLTRRIKRDGMTISEAIECGPPPPPPPPKTYEHAGKSLTIGQWAKEVGIPKGCLKERLCQFGWPIERALTQPVGMARNKSKKNKAKTKAKKTHPAKHNPRGYSTTSASPLGTGPGRQETHFECNNVTIGLKKAGPEGIPGGRMAISGDNNVTVKIKKAIPGGSIAIPGDKTATGEA
jgi:hypothetical protein